jgi:hypothetical protein
VKSSYVVLMKHIECLESLDDGSVFVLVERVIGRESYGGGEAGGGRRRVFTRVL